MKSISGKHWEEIIISKRLVDKTKIDFNLSETLSKIVISRNFTSTEIYSINNEIEFKNPFFVNSDFRTACEILKKNINLKNKILVIGDYDVDGCVSTALMVNFFNKLNLEHDYYIPDRFKDGYGANLDLITKLIHEKNPKLVFFVDNGSNSYEAIKFLNKLDIDSIIIDHHNINIPYPRSGALINPKKNPKNNEYNYLCSSLLTYFYLDIYIRKNNLDVSIKKDLIYVLLAVVADVMPLRGINRFLCKDLLRNFDINKNPIIKYLFKLNNIKKKLELDDLGYFIAPIINSAGRLQNANQIVELFTTLSEIKKKKILENINNLNLKRKKLEKECIDKINLDKLLSEKGIIFIFFSYLQEGIIGIIASKLKEYFNKPCVILTKSQNIIKGSARSTSQFNIGEYISIAVQKKILLSGGGHNLAAGLTISKSNINLFKSFINDLYKKKFLNESKKYISKISLSAINKTFMSEIDLLGPFGNGNPIPSFLIENVKIIKPTLLNNKFISCYVKSNSKIVKAISFNPINSKISLNLMNYKKSLNIISKIKQNTWNNKNSIQLEIIDVIK